MQVGSSSDLLINLSCKPAEVFDFVVVDSSL